MSYTVRKSITKVAKTPLILTNISTFPLAQEPKRHGLILLTLIYSAQTELNPVLRAKTLASSARNSSDFTHLAALKLGLIAPALCIQLASLMSV
jgi:hypothetical protein